MYKCNKIYIILFNDGYEPIMKEETIRSITYDTEKETYTVRTFESRLGYTDVNYFESYNHLKGIGKKGYTSAWTATRLYARNVLKELKKEFMS